MLLAVIIKSVATANFIFIPAGAEVCISGILIADPKAKIASMYLCIYVSMYLCIYVSMYLCIYASPNNLHLLGAIKHSSSIAPKPRLRHYVFHPRIAIFDLGVVMML